MKPRMEEVLYLMLWSLDVVMHPTFRNLTDPLDAWADRRGWRRQLDQLEKRQLVDKRPEPADERLLRLTEKGRLHALGGRDPEARWARAWDGLWRMVVFDVPVGRDSDRRALRRYLHDRHFGYLQNSLWISPDPLTEEREHLTGVAVNVERLILLDARPCAGERDEQLVTGGWDFARINQKYDRYLAVLANRPTVGWRGPSGAAVFRKWATEERLAWREAVHADPLLPVGLLPGGYRGQEAWRRRVEVLTQVGRQLARTMA